MKRILVLQVSDIWRTGSHRPVDVLPWDEGIRNRSWLQRERPRMARRDYPSIPGQNTKSLLQLLFDIERAKLHVLEEQ